MKHKYKSHKSIRKLKNKNHQILCSLKGDIKRCHSKNKGICRKNSQSENCSEGNFVNNKAKRIIMGDSRKGREYIAQLLLGYTSLFPGKTLDIKKEIYNFSRNTILQIVLIFGQKYGSCRISDMEEKPFFSYKSELSILRMQKIYNYIKRNEIIPYYVSYASPKTFLELLKLTFSVSPELCQDKYEPYIEEIKIFDLLLALNEQKVTPFLTSKTDDFAGMIYTGLYAPSEFTNNNETLDLSEQMYYALTFFEFITTRIECKNIKETFLNHFSINDWREYFLTIVEFYFATLKKGLGFFDLNEIDPEHKLDSNIPQRISISENDCIDDEKNRDFVVFRSHPLIRMNDGRYLLYNKQLLIKRLYNSIYFDLSSYNILYKNQSFSQFYKGIFVEKYLFDHSILGCLEGRKLDECFPRLSDIKKDDFIDGKEEQNQPDFYFREGDSVFIFECKAIKLNGNLKVEASVDDILDELENKLSVKRWNLQNGVKKASKEKPEGVGQLANHIARLENCEFKWDTISPDAISFYYPVLVLENSEVAQAQLSAIANEWFQKKINQNLQISKEKCKPLIVMTIKTLFFYDHLFKKDGFKYYFDEFIKEYACYEKNNTSSFSMDELNDFDTWMRTHHTSNKDLYYYKKYNEINEWKNKQQVNKGI